MSFSLVAALLGALTIFFVGFLWFNQKTFFPIWWRAIGRTGDPGAGNHSMGVLFGSALLASLIQGLVLAWLLARLAPESGLTVLAGFGYGLLLGVAFAAAPSLGHRLFGQQGFTVWGIEVGADALGLALAGAVISFWY